MGIDQKKIELLKKLRALAERGVGGEKEAAQKRLDALMEKYQVAEADLSDDALDTVWINYRSEWEKRLFDQICGKNAPDRDIYRKTRGDGMRTKRGCECTKAEALQIQIEYEFYRELWAEELDIFFTAFISKHQLYSKSSRATPIQLSLEEEMRLAMLMGGLQDKQLLKMIEN